MRRLIALLAGVTVVFAVAAGPVAAETGAPAPTGTTAALPKDAVGLSPAQVAGTGIAVTLDAGASEEHDIVVSNHTANLRLTVKLAATDATGNLGAAAASWLSFGDDAIQLDPHVATTVPMTIAVPHDTQPGSVLAHVSATVESAVSAADGSPVTGTATDTFPVSIVVSGTPTAQIAIADVHRVDQGSQHQLAVVLRNFGQQGAKVSGHVVVVGDSPQTIPFQADLAASRDTTLDLDWKAPPAGTASDLAVDLEYGGGDVASWSSQLGGAPTNLSPSSSSPAPATVPAAAPSSSTTSVAGPAKPWWKQPFVTGLAILALLGAALWFGFEMRASRRRRVWVPGAAPAAYAAHPGAPPGWVPTASAESLDLAKQIVRLTDVVVQLVESHRLEQDVAAERVRARSPDTDVGGSSPPRRPDRAAPEEMLGARAGPEPPGRVRDPESIFETSTELPRSAPPVPGASARPVPRASAWVEPVPDELEDPDLPPVEALLVYEPEIEPEVEPDVEPVFTDFGAAPAYEHPPDPRAAMMGRLVELDRQRRKLRDWMDTEDSGVALEPPVGAPDPRTDV